MRTIILLLPMVLAAAAAAAGDCPAGMSHHPTQNVCNFPPAGVKKSYPQPRQELLNWRQYRAAPAAPKKVTDGCEPKRFYARFKGGCNNPASWWVNRGL